jgi:crotonobetainyl-CoA:carnitine CoA-transferase CaiB-like acyl-CoA transferase
VALSFKHEDSLGILHQIIDTSDILVENYIPGTLNRYGLDYATVSKRKPGIIYASITGSFVLCLQLRKDMDKLVLTLKGQGST